MAEKPKELSERFTTPDAKFSDKYFKARMEAFDKLANMKPSFSNPKGLAAYLKLDPNAATYDEKTLQGMYGHMQREEKGYLTAFSAKNVGGLVGLLAEEDAEEIVFGIPQITRKDDPKYNAVASAIGAHAKLTATLKDPRARQEYVMNILKKLPQDALYLNFLAAHADLWLEGTARISQGRTQKAIAAYGAKKYLAANASYYKEIGNTPETKEETEAGKKIAELQQKAELSQDSKEKVKIAEEIEAISKKIGEKYKDKYQARGLFGQIVERVMQDSYQAILVAEAKKKAEEEAKAKAQLKVLQGGKAEDEELEEAA